MDPVIFTSSTLRIACVSDTHNDDPRQHIPAADILIHAGDFTDDGTLEELQTAFEWISALPHKVKVVVAGNHDLGLDPSHPRFLREAVELFTSTDAKKCGIHYIDRETKTVAHIRPDHESDAKPVRIYGNPCQPDFLKSAYAFTYLPYPSEGSETAWATAPSRENAVDIWAMHSPPKGRLDFLPLPPLTGCELQLRKIAQARPMLCVFGHYHYSWGAERVRWRGDEGQEIEKVEKLSKYEGGRQEFDFSGHGKDVAIERGMETIFVNAGWMTMEKRKVERRNPSFVITLLLPNTETRPGGGAEL